MQKTILTIPIWRLLEHPYAVILSYPRPTKKELTKRLEELKKLNVATISFQGPKQLLNLHILGKGCVGLVVMANANGKEAALKIRRVDADRATMRHEAQMLKKANSTGVGPKLLAASKNFLVMQYVKGQTLEQWLIYHEGKREKEKVLREILEQCWRLDQAILDHGELSYAAKHVIVERNGKPTIVDFETASANRHPANVTAISQYLFFRSTSRQASRPPKRRQTLIERLRSYKKDRNRTNFENVLKALALDHVVVRCF
jgi:putative serine/threonine protein kinase